VSSDQLRFGIRAIRRRDSDLPGRPWAIYQLRKLCKEVYGFGSMSPPRIDLNLLLVFEAVLETKSTTLAAAHLGLTQSAVSNALNRLRSALGDPLFVRTSEGMLPTPRASEISLPVKDSIERIRAALGHAPEFDAQHSSRTFRVFMSDVGQMVLLPQVLAHVMVEAPEVTLETVQATTLRQREAAMSSGEVDLAVGYFQDFEGPFHGQSLFREHYVCVVRADHPLVGDELTLEQFAALRHAVYHPSGGGHNHQEQAIDAAIAALGVRRHVTLRAMHFLGFTRMLRSTDIITTLPSRLAAACAAMTPVRIFKPPLEIPTFEIAQFWHKRFHQDPGNRWLRRLFARYHAALDRNDQPPAEQDLGPEEGAG
jgi:DNA-binding transcriptional LysR family regulator